MVSHPMTSLPDHRPPPGVCAPRELRKPHAFFGNSHPDGRVSSSVLSRGVASKGRDADPLPPSSGWEPPQPLHDSLRDPAHSRVEPCCGAGCGGEEGSASWKSQSALREGRECSFRQRDAHSAGAGSPVSLAGGCRQHSGGLGAGLRTTVNTLRNRQWAEGGMLAAGRGRGMLLQEHVGGKRKGLRQSV